MEVSEGMSTVVLTIGPGITLREAARLMDERHVGAAVVIDPDSPGPGILTERDILQAVAAGEDCEQETAAAHMSDDVIAAAPDWSLERAAETMGEHKFRHLLVVDGAEIVGVLSMRDIVRRWSAARAAG